MPLKRLALFSTLCALTLAGTVPASAEQWVDYAPQKGYWEIRYVKVDPNKIDEYLTQARISWMPGEEALKRRGLIYGYQVLVSITPANGNANVIVCVHHVRFANLDPNKARDQELEKEMNALLPKDKSAAMAARFDKYRVFVGDEIYIPVEFAK